MSFQGNWVDFVILATLFFYAVEGLGRGFWVLVAELGSFVGSLILALRFYPLAARLLVVNFSFPHSFANAIGFIVAAFLAEALLFVLARYLILKLPKKILVAPWTKFAGVLPATIDGLILVAFFLTLFVALPLKPQIKADLTSSRIGGYLVRQTAQFEKTLAGIFGGAIKDTLTYFTIEPGSRERVDLTYQPTELRVDEQAETQMFVLVNEERRKAGLPELVWDPQIVVVARAHSRDMWERQYFSHINPDGEDPGDRLEKGGVEFTIAGENLALAPSVSLAHQGLMNSEGHRKNILDPEFRRIGIGVVDGGVYGKMFTQNFTD